MIRKTVALCFLFLLNGAVFAKQLEKTDPRYDNEDAVIEELKKGGFVIYLRHHATNKDEEDKDKKNLKNCKTQRNLSPEGKEGSKEIGKAFRKLGIKVSKVLSSPYCRCIDTARLAFDSVDIVDDLHFSIGNSFFNRLGTNCCQSFCRK